MSKRIIHIKTILLAFLIAAFIGNIFILFCHFHYDLQKTIIITFILFIIYMILGCYIFFIDKCQDSWLHWLYRLPKQLFIISFFIMFFLISAYISEYTNIPFSARVCLPINAIFVFCIGNLICWIYVVFLTKYSLKIRIKISPKKLIPILFLAIIPTLIRLPMLDTLQRWDAGEYYYALGNACQSFTYSWSGFFDSFRLCNHTTLGFSLLMAPGEFLNPRGITGVLIINLLLTTGSVICLYLLLKKVFNQISDRYLWGIAMIYSIVPFFLGSFGYLTPDYIVPIVFIFAVMAEYKKEYLLEFFWFSIMANTKEFSIIIIFGYFLAKFIFTIISNWRHKDCYKIILRNGSLWAGLLSGLFFLLILFLQGGILWKGGNPDSNTVSFSNTGINCFGINFSYILFRLKQHFILNFSWIITLLVIINIIIYWIKRKKSTYSFIKNEFLVSLGGALGFAILSNMIYITAGAYRYATFFLALYPVFAILFCYKTVKYFLPKACKLMIPIIGCLFFIET